MAREAFFGDSVVVVVLVEVDLSFRLCHHFLLEVRGWVRENEIGE